MAKRFVAIWFRHLITDWCTIRQPELANVPFVLTTSSHGRMVITAASPVAQLKDISAGMVLADARAMVPALHIIDDIPTLTDKLLTRLAIWCIRFAPIVAIDPPEGLLLDVTGCSHLWGSDQPYIADIAKKLHSRGYFVSVAIADTVGAAWAVARFGRESFVIEKGMHAAALLPLPPAALRLDIETVERLHKLGLLCISRFIHMPRTTLRRRFGQAFIKRLHQALGLEEELILPVESPVPYQDRLPCLEPIVTAKGIEIALQKLLASLCRRLQQEQKGLRLACFKGYRVDGKTVQVNIATNRPSHNLNHLFKLFEIRLPTLEPDLGIELFVLEAPKVEDHAPVQEKLWEATGGLENLQLSELVDRLAYRVGMNAIRRYLPDEHYWPERSFKLAAALQDKPAIPWNTHRPRPLQLLPVPEPIMVTAPIPDYPPMSFQYKGKFHKIAAADGPERIEQEWWLQQGQHRDYYYVEDVAGERFWLFRLGHYDATKKVTWFMHGFFA